MTMLDWFMSSSDAIVVATQDWHPEHTPHFVTDGGIWPVHCVHDTWGAAFHPELRVVERLDRLPRHGRELGLALFVRGLLARLGCHRHSLGPTVRWTWRLMPHIDA